jgi:glucose/mannose-6-phosphate isomerase
MILAEGGELARLAKRWSIPAYIFKATANPSGQPRMGTGYMLFGLMGLLAAAKQLRLTEAQVELVVRRVRAVGPRWSEDAPAGKNRARQLAHKLIKRVPIIVGSEHLEHTALAFRNRLHENSKHFAECFPLPSLNHHLLEGLGHPKQHLFVVFLNSDRVYERTQRRYAITRRVFTRQGIPSENINLKASSALEEVCLQLTFSGYVSFWLAMEHALDPSPIPWVDYFKAQLA